MLTICSNKRAWFVLTLVAVATPVYAGTAADLLEQVRAVPRHNEWGCVAPEQRPVLKSLIEMPAAERDQLLRSDDARLRGIAIFITEQQGDLVALLSLRARLADNAPTVPFATPAAQIGEYPVTQQTVADYLTAVYKDWFGVDVDKSPERFDSLLGPIKDQPQSLVQPWIVRLRRAGADEKAVADVKQRIAALPDELRWAVVTLGYGDSLYTRDEARTLLNALSAPVQGRLRAGEALLPNEPLFRSTSFRSAVLRVYEELTAS
jgi:hypothetical protein